MSLRWHRRRLWLHCLVSASESPTDTAAIAGAGAGNDETVPACDAADDVKALLTDPRLVRVERDSKLVYSLIVGKAAQFLSGCCEWERCPAGAPYADGESARSTYVPFLDADDGNEEDEYPGGLD